MKRNTKTKIAGLMVALMTGLFSLNAQAESRLDQELVYPNASTSKDSDWTYLQFALDNKNLIVHDPTCIRWLVEEDSIQKNAAGDITGMKIGCMLRDEKIEEIIQLSREEARKNGGDYHQIAIRRLNEKNSAELMMRDLRRKNASR